MPSGLAKVLLFVKAAPVWQKKDHCRISFAELKNIGLGLQEVVLPSCVEKLMVKQSPTLIHLRHAKTFLCEFDERMYSVLNHLEPTRTSLNLSWHNVCAGEQLGNHF